MTPLVSILFLCPILAGPPTFCGEPAQCGPQGVCLGGTCRVGVERGAIEVLHTVAVVPGLVLSREAWVRDEAREVGEDLGRALAFTGFYELLAEEDFPPGWELEGVSPAEADRERWQRVGASRRVRPALTPTGDPGAYILQIHTLETETFRPVRLPEGDVIVRPGGRLSAVAGWVDALLEHDTGLRGVVGSRIAATFQVQRGQKEVGLVETHGGEPVWVTQNGSLNLSPAWSVEGVVGYMSYRSGNTDWVIDGVPLSNRPGLNAAGAFSPNGRWLALSLAEGGNSEVVILDAKTGRVRRRVTRHAAIDTSPAWSPDGSRLAFVSDRTGKPQVWIADLKRKTETRITDGGYVTSPTWSPLGERIIYAQKLGPRRFALIRHDLGSGHRKRLTPRGVSDDAPCYSPDGRYVVFVRREGQDDPRLWIMQQDGERARPLATGSLPAFTPDWGHPYRDRGKRPRKVESTR